MFERGWVCSAYEKNAVNYDGQRAEYERLYYSKMAIAIYLFSHVLLELCHTLPLRDRIIFYSPWNWVRLWRHLRQMKWGKSGTVCFPWLYQNKHCGFILIFSIFLCLFLFISLRAPAFGTLSPCCENDQAT